MPPSSFGTGLPCSAAIAREPSGTARCSGPTSIIVASSTTLATSIRPTGVSAATASCAVFAPTSAPMLAPTMITGKSLCPLFRLKVSAANAHSCATTMMP